MKKFLLSIALVLFAGATMAQKTIDLTFSRDNSATGTDAAVAVASTGDLDVTGITSKSVKSTSTAMVLTYQQAQRNRQLGFLAL